MLAGKSADEEELYWGFEELTSLSQYENKNIGKNSTNCGLMLVEKL